MRLCGCYGRRYGSSRVFGDGKITPLDFDGGFFAPELVTKVERLMKAAGH